MDRRHQDRRHRRAQGRGPRPARARQAAGARLPHPGDQRRVLPRRHAPRKPVRAPRRVDRGDRLRDHGPDRPPRAAMASGNSLRPHHRQLPPRRRDPLRGAVRAELHSVDEFATALRAVGEPMRGKPVSELSVGMMLDGLFAITRDFDMQTQPHLLLLQKTMVMVEGIATLLDPEINMWDVSSPYVKSWIRDELGPEAALADKIREDVGTLLRLPELIRRIEDRYPARGGAPEQPPLPEIELVWERRPSRWPGYLAALLAGGA